MTRKRSWTCRCQRMAEVFCIFLYVCACEDVAVLPNLAGASFSAVVVVEACFGAYNCCRCGPLSQHGTFESKHDRETWLR